MEVFRALGALVEPPSPSLAPVAEALALGALPGREDHGDLFTFQLYPYASVYLGGEGMLGGEARDRVAGFWRALGVEAPAEPDHLAAMLAGFATLCEASATSPATSPAARRARDVFAAEHLGSWLPVFLARAEELGVPFYRGWARLLADALAAVAGDASDTLPAHLRAAPPLDDPRALASGDGEHAWLVQLLAPVRCGFVLTRDDLRRAARDLGLGGRIGERRYVLRALFGQAPGPVLTWLAVEAARQAALPMRASAAGATAAFWSARARSSSVLLGALATDVALF